MTVQYNAGLFGKIYDIVFIYVPKIEFESSLGCSDEDKQPIFKKK